MSNSVVIGGESGGVADMAGDGGALGQSVAVLRFGSGPARELVSTAREPGHHTTHRTTPHHTVHCTTHQAALRTAPHRTAPHHTTPLYCTSPYHEPCMDMGGTKAAVSGTSQALLKCNAGQVVMNGTCSVDNGWRVEAHPHCPCHSKHLEDLGTRSTCTRTNPNPKRNPSQSRWPLAFRYTLSIKCKHTCVSFGLNLSLSVSVIVSLSLSLNLNLA